MPRKPLPQSIDTMGEVLEGQRAGAPDSQPAGRMASHTYGNTAGQQDGMVKVTYRLPADLVEALRTRYHRARLAGHEVTMGEMLAEALRRYLGEG